MANNRLIHKGFLVTITAGAWMALAVLGGILAANVAAARAWPLSVLGNLVVQALVASLILAVLLLLTRRKRLAAAATGLAVAFALVVGHAVQGARQFDLDPARAGPVPPSQSLTVITYNLWDRNPRMAEVARWLATGPADLVVMTELPVPAAETFWRTGVYAHRLTVHDPAIDTRRIADGRTIGLYSRHPIVDAFKFRAELGLLPAAFARLEIPGAAAVWVVAVDSHPPMSAARLADRDRLLLALARRIGELDGPVIVAGDFNATPFTPVFGDFLRYARLAPAGLFPATWPVWLGPFGIRIDHILVRGLAVGGAETLPARGSDHRPLRLTLELPSGELR